MTEDLSNLELELWSSYGIYLLALILGVLTCAFLLVQRTLAQPNFRLRYTLPPWPLQWSDVLLMCWILIVILLLAQGVILSLVPQDAETFSLWPVILSSIVLQGGLAIAYIIFRRARGQHVRHDTQSSLSQSQSIRQGLFLFLGLLPAIWIVSVFWQLFLRALARLGLPLDLEPQAAVEMLYTAGTTAEYLGLSFIAVVIAPIVEEYFFRAGLYRFLKSRFRPVAAILLSSLIFSLMHASLTNLLPLMALGCLLCWVYEHTGNLRTVIYMHAFFNLNSIVLIFILPA